MKTFLILIFPALLFSQTTYYVSSSGDDTNSGISSETPWKTPHKVATMTFATSDSILFNRGDTFYGEFSRTTIEVGYNGTANDLFYIGAYGTGAKPIFILDGSDLVWTATTHDSIYGAWIGKCYSTIAYEDIGGIWTQMTNKQGGTTRLYLDDPDSIDAYLNTLTVSSYGPAVHETVGDTVYVKTSDGNAPNVKILRQNFFNASYLKMENLDFRNGWHGIQTYPANNSTFRNLYFRNMIGISFYLAGHSGNNLVDSCRADSGAYTMFYSWQASGNRFAYDSAITVIDTIMGIYSNIEQAGFGVERDTGTVIEYCYVENATQGGIDSYFNTNDTIRYCTIVNSGIHGIFLSGDEWVAHNNTVTASTGMNVSIDRYTGFPVIPLGQTHVYDNTLTVSGRGLNFTSNGGVFNGNGSKGTVLFENNTVTGSASNTNLSFFEAPDSVTSINNNFFGVGRWAKDAFPNYIFYTTLTAFQGVGFESGSTINEEGGAGDTLSVLSGNGEIQTILSRITLTAITDSADIRKSGHHGVWSVFSVPSGAWEQTFIDTVSTSDEFGLLTATVRLGGKTGNYVFRFTADEALEGSPLDITVTAVRNGSVIFTRE